MTLRYGSLFSGYGGLDLGLQSVLGGTTAWFSEFDKHPSAILAHHWPDIPNLGDITKIDFTKVEPVDVLTGGFPCQDVSHAGRRAGLIRDGEGRTRSGLWGEMLRAITELRPRLVVAENVRGLLSARADSDVEPCPWCLGDASGEPDMRALGAVLADLADVGYDAWWVGLRAADVGASHGRFRVFIFAAPRDAECITGRLAADVGGVQRPRTADCAHAPADSQPIPRGEHGAAGGVETATPRRVPTDRDEARAGAVGGGSLDSGGQAADPGQLHARRRLEGDNQCATNPSPVSPAGTMTPSTSSAPIASPQPSRQSPQGSPTSSEESPTSGPSSPKHWPPACPDVLMPTPTAADSAASGGSSPSGVTLTDAVVRTDMGRTPNPRHEAQRLLPTPTAFACEADSPARSGGGGGPGLSQVIVHNELRPSSGPNQRGSSGDLMLPGVVQGLGEKCPTCGCSIDYHDADGFCAGPCGGNRFECYGRTDDDAPLPTPVHDIRSEKTLLPTPMAVTRERTPEEMIKRTEKRVSGEMPSSINLDEVPFFGFGDYAPAIARWENVLGRPAPAPTEPGPKGSPRLSARFVEWMMGLPAGHVTGVDIPRNAQLKALGNGVVPQQAAAAARWWLAQIQETAA